MTPHHRGGCRTPIGEQERDGIGRPDDLGSACATCPGCDTPHGDVGTAGEALQMCLSADAGGLQILWRCPKCNRSCTEDTDWLSVIGDVRVIETDPLCVFCRRAAA